MSHGLSMADAIIIVPSNYLFLLIFSRCNSAFWFEKSELAAMDL